MKLLDKCTEVFPGCCSAAIALSIKIMEQWNSMLSLVLQIKIC